MQKQMKEKEDRKSGKHMNVQGQKPSDGIQQAGEGKRRFSLSGSMPNVIQGGFEDKYVRIEGEQINEDELEKMGIS